MRRGLLLREPTNSNIEMVFILSLSKLQSLLFVVGTDAIGPPMGQYFKVMYQIFNTIAKLLRKVMPDLFRFFKYRGKKYMVIVEKI